MELSSSSRNRWTIYSADDEEFAAASVGGRLIIRDEDHKFAVFSAGDAYLYLSQSFDTFAEVCALVQDDITPDTGTVWNQVCRDILQDFQFNYTDQETYDTLDDVIDTARIMVSETYYDELSFEDLEDAEKRNILAYIFTLTDYGLKHDDRFPPPLEVPEALILILLSANRQCPPHETD